MPRPPGDRDHVKVQGRSGDVSTTGVLPSIERNKPRQSTSSRSGLPWPTGGPRVTVEGDLVDGLLTIDLPEPSNFPNVTVSVSVSDPSDGMTYFAVGPFGGVLTFPCALPAGTVQYEFPAAGGTHSVTVRGFDPDNEAGTGITAHASALIWGT